VEVIEIEGQKAQERRTSQTESNGESKSNLPIEVEALIGAPIRAILPGKVIYADWFKEFGNPIIIDHGDGIFWFSRYKKSP